MVGEIGDSVVNMRIDFSEEKRHSWSSISFLLDVFSKIKIWNIK